MYGDGYIRPCRDPLAQDWSEARLFAASDAVLPAKVQTQAHSARCAAGCAMGGRRAGLIVDQAPGSRLMSWESTKAVVATKAGRVWDFSDQISDRDVAGRAVRAGTAGAVPARSWEGNGNEYPVDVFRGGGPFCS